jgi:hypothetical protein
MQKGPMRGKEEMNREGYTRCKKITEGKDKGKEHFRNLFDSSYLWCMRSL